jgi:hypothetical protein
VAIDKKIPTPLLWKYLSLHFLNSFGWIVYWTMDGKANEVLRAKRDALHGWRGVWD